MTAKSANPHKSTLTQRRFLWSLILRSVIAIHSSHTLRAVYERLCTQDLFANHRLSINMQMSKIEPGNCRLNVQLTETSFSQRIIRTRLRCHDACTHTVTDMPFRQGGSASDDDFVNRISRLRCIAAMEEIESDAKISDAQKRGSSQIQGRYSSVSSRITFCRASFFPESSLGKFLDHCCDDQFKR